MTKISDKDWRGQIEQNEIGGPCTPRSGAVVTANITATISGDAFAAKKRNVSDGNDCDYSGTVRGSSITGHYFCKNGGPFEFELRR